MFVVYGLVAVSYIFGIVSVLMAVVQFFLLCTVACVTASPLCVWIVSALLLVLFKLSPTVMLMVCEKFSFVAFS